MIRTILGLVVCVIAWATFVTADEPEVKEPEQPVRLKKKKPNIVPAEQRPAQQKAAEEAKNPGELKPEDKKPDEKKAEDKKPEDMGEITKDGEPIDSGEEDKEVLERVARNMKSVEERLVNKELNDGTQQLQEDIVKDLDSLIQNSGNPQGGEAGGEPDQQPQGGGASGEKQQKKGSSAQKKSSSGQKKAGGQNNSSSGQKNQQGSKGQQGQKNSKNPSGGSSPKEPGKEGQGKGKEPNGKDKNGKEPNGKNDDNKNPGGNGTNPGNGGTGKDGDLNRAAELFKDAWGHLPETLRAQMDAYSNREKYMDKHQDLIKQYYKSIAAQGQRKKE